MRQWGNRAWEMRDSAPDRLSGSRFNSLVAEFKAAPCQAWAKSGQAEDTPSTTTSADVVSIDTIFVQPVLSI
jgi:hypothetical protein